MKKRFLLILVMLCWCGNAYAITQQQFIDQNLKGRKLDSIEGVWITEGNNVYGFYKSGSQYIEVAIRSTNFASGGTVGNFSKGSENIYYGTRKVGVGGKVRNTEGKIIVTGNTHRATYTWQGQNSPVFPSQRLWPEDIVSHNAKFKTKEDIQEEEKVLAAMVNDAKKTCKVLGFEDGSEKFADCTLKLYTQKVDELVAEKVAANTRMTQSQTTTQSSGSNTMTIYDPVRDNQRMINQGMKMLSGKCNIGVDC